MNDIGKIEGAERVPIDAAGSERVPIDAPARKRAAVETFARHEASLRRTAHRFSICADDADEALQRGLEILLRKAPSEDPRELARWTHTVVKHEALAVRAERERILSGPAAAPPEPGREDWVAMLPAEADGPAEQAERHETIERSREALATLKPQELRALTLLAEGYSYREIGQMTGYSPRKVNRCVAEGRERFRRFLVRREGGARCNELAPLLSAFADGEVDSAAASTLREHLHTCPHCRATLRAYRAVPRAAAALAPVIPLRGGLVDRLQDAYAAVATRIGGGSPTSDSTLGGFAAAGGTRGAGMAALAKVLAICAGTVGGAAACVATGVVPAPLLDSPEHQARPAAKVSHHPRRLAQEEETATAEYQPAVSAETESGPTEREHRPPPKEGRSRHEHHDSGAAEPEAAGASAPPPSENGAVEFTEPAPTPIEETASSSSSSASTSTASASSTSASASSGSAAGEFGP